MTKLRQDGDRLVCPSCYLFNCWHGRLAPCDEVGCQCTIGNVREDPPERPECTGCPGLPAGVHDFALHFL